MNVQALAECYSRSHGYVGRPEPGSAVAFEAWLKQYVQPRSDAPPVPNSQNLSLAAFASSSDGEGGVSAWWFLSGNNVVGVPVDAFGKPVSYCVPYSALDAMPVVRLVPP